MIRVLLVDGQRMMREALRDCLPKWQVSVTADAGEASEAIEAFAEHNPDVVVCNLDADPASMLELIRGLGNRAINPRVLAISVRPDPETLAEAFRAGASGLVLSTSTMAELSEAITRTAAGHTVISSELRPVLIAQATANGNTLKPANGNGNGHTNGNGQSESGRRCAKISKRENEVLQLIADGCSTPEVAEQLFISQKTVKNHLASVYQKLDARDRTQAVLEAVRLGLVTLG